MYFMFYFLQFANGHAHFIILSHRAWPPVHCVQSGKNLRLNHDSLALTDRKVCSLLTFDISRISIGLDSCHF